jgi:hypothetical protein
MVEALFTFAGHSLRVEGWPDAVRLARGVLRHHERPAAAAASAVLAFVPAAAACAVTPGLLRRDERTWTWSVPRDIVRAGPDWFFYHGFAWALHQMWDALGFVRLHAALLYGERSGGILVAGERHDGKSSVAAGWLGQGGALATDDTVLLNPAGRPPLAAGVLRELHLDSRLFPMLPGLDGLADSEPYLPGRSRVRYDWVTRYPAQVVRGPVSVDAVIRTRVSAGGPTSARRVDGPEAAGIVRAAVEGEPGRLEPAAEWLAGVPAWEVTWGPDLWSMPGLHYAYLTGLLEVAR